MAVQQHGDKLFWPLRHLWNKGICSQTNLYFGLLIILTLRSPCIVQIIGQWLSTTFDRGGWPPRNWQTRLVEGLGMIKTQLTFSSMVKKNIAGMGEHEKYLSLWICSLTKTASTAKIHSTFSHLHTILSKCSSNSMCTQTMLRSKKQNLSEIKWRHEDKYIWKWLKKFQTYVWYVWLVLQVTE